MQNARLNIQDHVADQRSDETPKTATTATRRRILVIGPQWIGDMVMAQSLFKALKRRHPGCTLDVIGPAWAPGLLNRMPEVDRCIVADTGHGELGLGKRWRLGRRLHREGYDQAFSMSRSLKSALVPWFAGIPQRTGYLGERRYGIINDVRELNTTDLTQKAQHYVALGLDPNTPSRVAADIEQPRLAIDEHERDRLVAQHGLTLERPVVALTPGAAHGPAKRWSSLKFAALAKELANQGFQCWVFGGDIDVAIGDQIAAAAPDHCINLCGKTSLGDVIDLMSLARTTVGNDTGLTHIASAAVPHVVALYGSTHPDYAPPLCDQPVQLWLGLPCSPCKAKNCPLGHTLCLQDLPVADVVRACIAPDDATIPSRYSPA